MNVRLVKKLLPPIIPYVTIGLGLLVFHNAWLAILGYHAGMVAVMALSGTEIGIRRAYQGKRFWVPVVTALAGAGGGIMLYVLWPVLAVPDDINAYIRSIGLNERTWPVFLAYFILVNPALEEYYWRGHLKDVIRGLALNDVLFAGYHLIVLAGQMQAIWLIVVFTGLTGGAWFWRQTNRLNGGLLASTVSHLAADITVILTIYYVSIR